MAIEAGDITGRLRIDTAEAVSNIQQFGQRGREELNGLATAARPVGKEFDGIGQATIAVGQKVSAASRETQNALQQQGAAARANSEQIKAAFAEGLLTYGAVQSIEQAIAKFGLMGKVGVESADQIKAALDRASLALKNLRPDTSAVEALGRKNAGGTAEFLDAKTRFGFATGAEAESLRLIQQGAAEFARYGQAGVESFDSIRAAAESANASIRSTTQTTAAQSRNRQTLFSDSGAKLSGGDTDQANFVRAEKARSDAIKTSRQNWKEFEDSVRSGAGNIGNSLQSANTATSALASGLGTLRNAAGALGIALSLKALIDFTLNAAEAVSHIKDLSEQTGISAERLAALRPILESSGTSVDQFAAGMRSLLRQMVDGTPDVVKAMNDLGISTQRMLELTADPQGAIDAVASGLLKLENQGKSTATIMQVLERAGFQLAPALKEVARAGGISALPSTLSQVDIEKINKGANAWKQFKLDAENAAAISFAKLVESIDKINSLLALIPGNAKNARLSLGDFFSPQQLLPPFLRSENRLPNRIPDARAGAQLGGMAPIISAEISGPKTTDSQTAFIKSLQEGNEQLGTQLKGINETKEAAAAASAQLIRDKAKELDLTGTSVEFQKQLNKQLNEFQNISNAIAQGQLAETLNKQNQSINAQVVAMTQGKQAAEELAIANTLADSKLRNYGKAAEEAADKQRQLNAELARAQITNILGPADNSAGLSKDLAVADRRAQVVGPTVNRSDQQLQALQKARDALLNDTDPRTQALSKDIAVKLQVQIDQASVNSAIEGSQIGERLAQSQAAVFNKTFSNTINVDAARVETLRNEISKALSQPGGAKPEALGGLAAQLDQARLKSDIGDIQRGLDQNAASAQIFGRSFDLANANVQTLESGIQKMLNEGLKPSNEEVQKLAAQLKDAKVDAVFSDLSKDIHDAGVEAKVFGGSFDQAGANISALTDAIKKLIKEGFGELSPEIQDLKAQLEDQKAFQTMKDTANDLFDVLQRGATGQIKTWKDFGLQIKQVLDSAASKVLKEQFNNLLSDVFKPPEVKIPGQQGQKGVVDQVAITGIQTQAQTAQISINAIRDAALAAIAAARAQAGPLGTLPTSAPAAGAEPRIIGEVSPDKIFSTFPSPTGVPLPDNQDSFMRDANKLADEMAADLEHAIATGGSLMSRQNELAGISPVTSTNLLPQAGTGGLMDILKLIGGGIGGRAGAATGGFADIFKILTTGQIPLPSPIITDRFGPPLSNKEIAQSGMDPRLFGLSGDAAKKIADEGITAIENAGSVAEKGITDTSETSKSGLDSLLETALKALSSIGIGSSIPGGGSMNLGELGGLLGGVSNFFSGGGGAAVGFGSAPAGVEGPAMANGGFFSSGLGWLSSLLAFEKGGLIPLNAPRYDKGGLVAGEVTIIGHEGEFVLPKAMVQKIGVGNLEEARRTGNPAALASMDISGLKPSVADGVRAQWVGKNGPEMFTPRVAGEIVPLSKIGEVKTKFPQVDYSSVLNGRMNGGDVGANQTFTVGEAGLPELFLPDVRGTSDKFMSRGGGGGRFSQTNVFPNANFENRRSVGQNLARITAASRAGNRNT